MPPEYLPVRLVYKKEPCVKFLCRCPLPKSLSIPILKSSEKTVFKYAFAIIRGGVDDEIQEVIYIEQT